MARGVNKKKERQTRRLSAKQPPISSHLHLHLSKLIIDGAIICIITFLSISSFPNKSLNLSNIITISKFSFELIKLQLETVFESRFTSPSQLVYMFAFISKMNKMVGHYQCVVYV